MVALAFILGDEGSCCESKTRSLVSDEAPHHAAAREPPQQSALRAPSDQASTSAPSCPTNSLLLDRDDPFSKMDSFIHTLALVETKMPPLTIKSPRTCGDCGDVRKRSHMCESPMDDTPYVWACWACHDKDHDPDGQCRYKIATLREHNDWHCQNCTSRSFVPWSLLCKECDHLFQKVPKLVNWSPCKGRCNRVGLIGRMCRFCVEPDEHAYPRQPITDPWFVNPYQRATRKGCLGCGAEGYDTDYCSRECMRE